MELLKQGLGSFVEREFTNLYKDRAGAEAIRYLGEDRLLAKKAIPEWDAAGLLKLMWESWNDVFRRTLGPADRSLVSELRDLRNKWAHQQTFTSDDTYRALDSSGRLLTARLGSAVGRNRENEDGAFAPALRRASEKRKAQERGNGHRKSGGRESQTLA